MTITTEQLRGVIDACGRGAAMRGLFDKDLIERMARELLADREPASVAVEFIPKNLDRALQVVGVAIPESYEEFNFQTERYIQRLIDRVIHHSDEFTSPPAPAVPEAMPEDSPYPSTVPGGAHLANAWVEGWNACRAAMLGNCATNEASSGAGLEAETGDNCATVSQSGWVSCDERMPDVEENYYLTFSDGITSVSYFFDGYFADQHVTHWMPLPAAPEDANNG